MKKLFITSAALLFVCVSCNQASTSSVIESDNNNSAVQKNIDAGHVVNKAIETGDVSALDSVLADDAVDHAGENGDIKGKDSIKSELAKIHTMFPDMKMETVKEVADEDYLFQWMRFTGTSNGSMGMPAGPFDINAVEVTRFSNGKASEHWEFMQPADMMKMMGGQKNMPPAKDTTRH